jgi:DNA-binding CsgD family transcriptional regulator
MAKPHNHGPLGASRRLIDHCALTEAETRLVEAFAAHGSSGAAAIALGLKGKAFSNRMLIVREKLGVATNAEAVKVWFAGSVAA